MDGRITSRHAAMMSCRKRLSVDPDLHCLKNLCLHVVVQTKKSYPVSEKQSIVFQSAGKALHTFRSAILGWCPEARSALSDIWVL